MPHPCPHHCPSGGRGAGGLVAVAVIIIVILARRPIGQAADDVIGLAVVTLEAVALVIGSAAALAALTAITYGGVRLHRRQARKRQAIPQPAQTEQALTEAHRPPPQAAIEDPPPPIHAVITDMKIHERK